MRLIFDPPEDCLNGEDGHTEFVTLCEVCGKYANMVYRKRGPRGAILKGHVIACSRACGETAHIARREKVAA